MASKKVTLQDIADELGISRNTVSKAINNTGSVSEETKNKIFQMAAEMGYKQFSMLPQYTGTQSAHNKPLADEPNEIALFTHSFMNGSHFGSKLLDSFQQEIVQHGYKLSIYMIRSAELEQLTLPTNFNREHTAGILCLELFSESYSRFLCEQSIPLLFVDTVVNTYGINLDADLLYMENKASSYTMLQSIIDHGCKHITFVGDYNHCQSFNERWQAYCQVLTDNRLPVIKEECILDEDENPYNDLNWITTRIKGLTHMPDAFFCANDYIAISVLRALKSMNIVVPRDVLVCGFDNAPESTVIEPSLTTVRIHSASMGHTAAEMLLSKIQCPSRPNRISYIRTDVIYRDSTGYQWC